MKAPLLGGAYEAASWIANAQRCVNLYPEVNPKDAPFPVTYYPTPGLVALVAPSVQAAVRGLYAATNGNGYTVIGANVYFVNPNWTLTKIGTILPGTTPVSFADNGTTAVLVDGTMLGYTINLATNAFAQILDGNFLGGDVARFLDTFIMFNQPGSQNFYSTNSNTITPFNPLAISAKTDYADNLVTLDVVRREIWLLGQSKSEIWYDVGGFPFPFGESPGAYVEHGCAAKYSPGSSDIALFWVGQDLQGTGVVWRGSGYQARRISTHAMEAEIQKYPTVSDAVGFTYQVQGHYFYQVSFPSGDTTWVWDDTTEQWHKRAWADANGALHRHRANCHAFMYGVHVVGDWSNGTLYRMDPSIYQDAGLPIPRIRSWPHLIVGVAPNGQMISSNGKRLMFRQFLAELSGGVDSSSDGNSLSAPPQCSLRWSNDKGKSFGNPVLQSLGSAGEYMAQPQWRDLGIARDRVFELSWSVNAGVALNGAWVDSKVLGT